MSVKVDSKGKATVVIGGDVTHIEATVEAAPTPQPEVPKPAERSRHRPLPWRAIVQAVVTVGAFLARQVKAR